MSPDDEGVLAFRLGRVEQELHELKKHIDSRLDRVQHEVRSAAFVPMNLYLSERDAEKTRVNDRLKTIDERVDGIRTVVMWAVGTMIAAAAVVIALVRAFA